MCIVVRGRTGLRFVETFDVQTSNEGKLSTRYETVPVAAVSIVASDSRSNA